MSKCEESCKYDAPCDLCAGSEVVEDQSITTMSIDIKGERHWFSVSNADVDPDTSDMDVCDVCCEHGVGKYFFKNGVCDFCDICASDLIGNQDSAYLKEI